MPELSTSRLEAFSDGIFAVIITIAVLGLRVPVGDGFADLATTFPTFLVYVFSFQVIGTYWNNHHYLLRAAKTTSTGVMWANLNLLLWLSFVPFTIEWLGYHVGAQWPSVAYAFILLMSGLSYTLLQKTITSHIKHDSALKVLIRGNLKGYVSLTLYAIALVAAFYNPYVSYVAIAAVALLWFVPDTRVIRENLKT